MEDQPKDRCCSRGKWIFFPLIGIAAVFLFSGIVMLLWNAILPDLIRVNPICYWQAMGLLILSKILFGGFRGFHRGHRPWRHMARHEHWRYHWMAMSEEERAKFMEGWKSCGCCSEEPKKES
jgi:hypothetical protein